MSTRPVWVWPPNSTEPVRAGEFSLDNKVGRFSYATNYRELGDAVALDPVRLPFTRSQRRVTETGQEGLFGIFRDASPEGFGFSLLQHLHGKDFADPLDCLEASSGDAVGAIEICDDIDRKLAWRAPSSDDLIEALAKLQPEESSTTAARDVMKAQGTSLGGERPKLTVSHEGQLWIAKLQLRGDAAHAPLREFAAMQAAARAGIDVAETQFRLVGSRELLLVKRFDRHLPSPDKICRRLYASAHTALRLSGAETRDDRSRSYVALSYELMRWCPERNVDAAQQQELFRRMAFNAICGNGDDHPRNHGLVLGDDGWQLSKAFDIAPYITFSKTLAMAVNRDGRFGASATALVQDCESFGYQRKEAIEYIEQAVTLLGPAWRAAVEVAGFTDKDLPAPAPDWLNLEEARTAVPASRRRGGRA